MSDRDGRIALTFQTDQLTGAESRVVSLEGTDSISRLARYSVVLETEEYGTILEDDLMLEGGSIVFSSDDGAELHRINGIVTEFRNLVRTDRDAPQLELLLQPRAYLASQFETLDVFLDMNVPSVVQKCLERCGLVAGEDFDLGDLPGATDLYLEREFIVQYKETDLDFIQRLCEHVGIHYHFDDAGVMVFGDANQAFEEVSRVPILPFNPQARGGTHQIDRVTQFDATTRNVPKKYVVRDYNWRNPGVDLLGEAEVLADGLGQVVEYGGHFKTPAEANNLAAVRAQEMLTRRWTGTGESPVPNLRAGATFMLEGHPMGDTELLVTRIRHYIHEGEYRNELEVINKETVFRPARLTPKPRVSGVLNGIVDASGGTEHGAIDDEGRYRVRFMYDTSERGENQASRAVRMAQPSAGGAQGFHFPLRPGVEVILTCVDGDPDRPIISGAMPNPTSASPVSASNANHNVIRTQQNQIDIDDQDARIKMSTNAFETMLQLGSPNEPNEGYMLKTANDAVTTAGKLWSTGAKVHTAMSTYHAAFAKKNIIQEAGEGPGMKGLKAFAHFAGAINDFASGAIGVANSAMDIAKNFADEQKKDADEAVTDAQTALIPEDEAHEAQTTEVNGVTVHGENEDQWRERRAAEEAARLRGEAGAMRVCTPDDPDGTAAEERASEHEKPATTLQQAQEDQAAATAEADAWKARKDSLASTTAPFTAALGLGTTATQTALKAQELLKKSDGGIKSIKDLWGDFKRFGREAEEIKAVVDAVAVAKIAKGVAPGRITPRTLMPAQPINYQSSTHSAVVSSRNLAGFYGKLTCSISGLMTHVSGRNTLMLHGNKYAELSAPTLKVTANPYKGGPGLFDIEAKDMKTVVEQDSYWESKKHIHIKSKGKPGEVKLEANTLYEVDAGKEWKVTAEKASLKVTKTTYTGAIETDWSFTVKKKLSFVVDDKALIHGKKEVTVKSDDGKFISRAANTSVIHGSTDMVLDGKTAIMKASSSKFKANASGVEMSASGQAKVKGSKVLLG